MTEKDKKKKKKDDDTPVVQNDSGFIANFFGSVIDCIADAGSSYDSGSSYDGGCDSGGCGCD